MRKDADTTLVHLGPILATVPYADLVQANLPTSLNATGKEVSRNLVCILLLPCSRSLYRPGVN